MEPSTPEAIRIFREARETMATLNAYTPFAGWYKGEHGKARTALRRAADELIRSLRDDDTPEARRLAGCATDLVQAIGARQTCHAPVADALAAYEAAQR